MIQTSSTTGISGHLIYVGQGNLSDLNGKIVNGSIALMEFNSADNWLNLVRFGARAVIFIKPEITTRFEAMQKNLDDLPLFFPRVWISKEDGRYLLDLLQKYKTLEVKVSSKIEFEVVEARNVVGYINGTQYPYYLLPKKEWLENEELKGLYYEEAADKIGFYSEDAIAISAHYDSFSYIPSLAPGADEAAGISTLLELVKYFSMNKPKRSIQFIAFSGHAQSLAGSRAYVKKYWYGLPGIRAHFNLDLSTDGQNIGVMFAGKWWPVYFGWPMSSYHPVSLIISFTLSTSRGTRASGFFLVEVGKEVYCHFPEVVISGKHIL